MNKEITVEIPFKFINEDICAGVKKGAVLNIVSRSAEVICKASDMVDAIEVDVQKLDVAESIHSTSVKLPNGLKSSYNSWVIGLVKS